MGAGYNSAAFVHLNREGSDSGWHRDRERAFTALVVNLKILQIVYLTFLDRSWFFKRFDKGQDVYVSYGQQFRNHSCWTWSLNEGKAGVPESHV